MRCPIVGCSESLGAGERLCAKCWIDIQDDYRITGLPKDYAPCGECGYDHTYEPEEAREAHSG